MTLVDQIRALLPEGAKLAVTQNVQPKFDKDDVVTWTTGPTVIVIELPKT